MAETMATAKLNIPKETTYINMPWSFLQEPIFKNLPIKARFILATIFTLNKISQKKFNCPAKIPYKEFVRRFGMSKETIAKYKQLMTDKDIIKDLGKSQYEILIKFNAKKCIKVDDYLHTTIFDMLPYEEGKRKRQRKAKKRLTSNSVAILAFITAMNQNNQVQPKGTYIASQERIGKAVSIPKTTAGDSVREIIAASLCDTEAAPHGLTKYTVKPELINIKHCASKVKKDAGQAKPAAEPKKKKLTKREQKQQELRTTAINTAILEHYARLRHIAEDRVEKTLDKALKDKPFKELYAQKDSLNFEIGLAAARDDEEKAAKLTQELLKLDKRLDERLKALRIDKRELTPQYSCRTCNDTGYDSGGRQCDCLKKFIKEIQI